jgi:uncharacterized protein (TIGR03437 family)
MRWVLIPLFALTCLCQQITRIVDIAIDVDVPIRRVDLGSATQAVGLLSMEHAHVRVRDARGGEWRAVELGHEGGALVWFEDGVREIELIAASSVRILAIDPGATEQKASLRPENSDNLTIVRRADWGCGADCTPREAPVFADVTHLVVHHSAGTNTATDWAAVVRSIWVLHVRGNGWNDIGYNYLIDPNGVIYEGRAGGDGVIGAHFSGVNTGTMGVCMIGTFSTQEPRPGAVASLRRLLSSQSRRWNLDPTGQTLHAASQLVLNVISGHRDAGLSARASGRTECPGNALYSYLPAVRRSVSEDGAACRLQLSQRNYCFDGGGGTVPLSFANPSACTVVIEGGASWMSARGPLFVVSPNETSARRSTDVRVNGQVVQITQAANGVVDAPCAARGGVVNAATFDDRPLGVNGIASVFGTGFLRDSATPRVLVNGTLEATIFAANETQINFLIPGAALPGSARLEILRGGVRSNEVMFWISEAVPGIFAIQNHFDGALNSSAAPVRAGDAVVVYVTGIGTNRSLPWSATIGETTASGLFLGPTPGFIGLGQANLVVPENVSAGEHPLTLRVSGAASQAVRLFVGR